jgi:hypothetical protein
MNASAATWGVLFELASGPRHVVDAVAAKASLRVENYDDELLVFVGPAFATRSMPEVDFFGRQIVARLQGLRVHDQSLMFEIRYSGLLHPDGKTRTTYARAIEPMYARSVVESELRVVWVDETDQQRAARLQEEQRLERERLERLAVAHVVPALHSTKAAHVEQLLQMDQNPTTLYNILEVIEADGEVPIESIATKSAWRNCKRSMCHPEVVGATARHVATDQLPPPKPMHLGEAQTFVSAAAWSWLQIKAGLTPSAK